mgnify:CR=1 FL=1
MDASRCRHAWERCGARESCRVRGPRVVAGGFRGVPAVGGRGRVFLVIRGRIVLRSRVRAGRGFVPWIAEPGEDFRIGGLVAEPRYATDARADEESETLFLSSARFRAFVREQPQHSLSLINQLMAERSGALWTSYES